jgi:hypothetical protein
LGAAEEAKAEAPDGSAPLGLCALVPRGIRMLGAGPGPEAPRRSSRRDIVPSRTYTSCVSVLVNEMFARFEQVGERHGTARWMSTLNSPVRGSARRGGLLLPKRCAVKKNTKTLKLFESVGVPSAKPAQALDVTALDNAQTEPLSALFISPERPPAAPVVVLSFPANSAGPCCWSMVERYDEDMRILMRPGLSREASRAYLLAALDKVDRVQDDFFDAGSPAITVLQPLADLWNIIEEDEPNIDIAIAKELVTLAGELAARNGSKTSLPSLELE